MARIFFALAAFAILLLVANVVLGLALGDLGESSRKYEAARQKAHDFQLSESVTNEQAKAARAEKDRQLAALSKMRSRFQPHIWLGIVASLVTILVNCISVTYFIGTSRWCREVVEAYGLDPGLAERSRKLKRRSFPFAFLGMATMLAIVALGAASDPGASLASPASWVMLHFVASLLGTAIIAFAFYVQMIAVGANYAVIQQILAEAEQMRKKTRGARQAAEAPSHS